VDLGDDPPKRNGLVGSSPAIERVRHRMKAVARTNSTVLLSGETGCGKGVAAREIYRLSARGQRPFVHVDCAALATSVIDSELFGHERGAFTGAVGRRAGRFERAERGTIFLDEIGDLEVSLQSKLLRVLHDREYERLGGSGTRAMTARVIAATNRDLRREVVQGRFRADLLFRINVFEIAIPPLRERRGDIPQLVRALLVQLATNLKIRIPAFTEGFTRCLMSYDWPGNVRELMNLLERLMVERGGAVLDESAVDGLLDRSWLPGRCGGHARRRGWGSGRTRNDRRGSAGRARQRDAGGAASAVGAEHPPLPDEAARALIRSGCSEQLGEQLQKPFDGADPLLGLQLPERELTGRLDLQDSGEACFERLDESRRLGRFAVPIGADVESSAGPDGQEGAAAQPRLDEVERSVRAARAPRPG
jgi:DNA-binding NtrC family response regulator